MSPRAYMSQHHEALADSIGKAVADMVLALADDPLQFLVMHLAQQAGVAVHTPHAPLRKYLGFTEHAYRLVFEYGEKFAPAEPRLQTILPSGVVENDKALAPKAEKGLIAYTYPQSITPDAAAAHMDTPFVWKRDDGSLAVLQTWGTNVNAKFRDEFEVSTSNPDPRIFKPQAVDEFRRAVAGLFGAAAEQEPVLFCHRASVNTKLVLVGDRATLLAHLGSHPEALAALNIARLTDDGFVAATVDGKGERGEKPFALGAGVYAVYVKQGWHTMACATPYEQFVVGRELHMQTDSTSGCA